jgi:formamidopyrimidine-DNA glycosylase
MPELPEVETVRRGIAPVLEGRRLIRVLQRRADLRVPFPQGFVARLEGRRVEVVGRRAKYLTLALDSGETLLVHLGMSGSFVIKPGGAGGNVLEPHDHAVFDTEAGDRLVFNDPRRFGLMTLAETARLDQTAELKDLGPEPLSEEFAADVLAAALARRHTPVKALLLDQRVVAGLGNIYVSEALYRAGISPRRSSHTIGAARAARLADAIKAVLKDAIAAGGSTLNDYVQADGTLGYFQHAFRVYDREGKPCATPGCGRPVRRIVQSGRSTFYCPACQR